MNPKIRALLLAVASVLLLGSCSSVRHLPDGQCMLVKNNVEVKDAKNPDFDNLKTYVRPVTNKKFMDLFRVKTVFYDWGQPTYNKQGETKDILTQTAHWSIEHVLDLCYICHAKGHELNRRYMFVNFHCPNNSDR